MLGIETLAEGKLIGAIDLRDAVPEIGNTELDIYIGDARTEAAATAPTRCGWCADTVSTPCGCT